VRTGLDHFDRFDLTDDDRAEIEDVMNGAVEVSAGRLPVYEWASLSSGRMRFVAMRTTGSDFRWPALIAAITELVRWRDARLSDDVRSAA
jgi:hypothetical protein